MKFALGQLVYYMHENRVKSAPVIARMLVENKHDAWAHTPQQHDFFTPFGPSRTMYATCHGLFGEGDCAGSARELLDRTIGMT